MVKFFRVNEKIQALKLRVIGPDGTQLGVLSRSQALEKARQADLDLVEVAPNTDPPVARIVDFEKFRYQEEKKERLARKNIQEVKLREIWLSPRIAQHDLEVRLKKAGEFLDEGDKVKLTVKFKGREMIHPEVGQEVLKKTLAHFGDRINIEREARFEGRNLTVIIGRR